MKHPFYAFVQLIFPFFVGAVLVIVIWTKTPTQLSLEPFGIGLVKVEANVGDRLLIGIILTVVVVATVLVVHVSRNYATFFPTSMQFTVLFDHQGIDATIRTFSKRERRQLRIEENWRPYTEQYIATFNEMLRTHSVPRYAVVTQTTTGTGEFNYKVQKARGWQTYQMTRAWGAVRFDFSGAAAAATLWVHYVLKPTEADCIQATLADLSFRFTKIVRPTLNQHVYVRPTRRLDIVDFICPTKVRFFPICRLGRTLYCAEKGVIAGASGEESHVLIPIAYAIYDVT